MSNENTSVINRATAHFSDRISGEMNSIQVDEWDVEIFWRPLNLKKQNTIYKAFRTGSLEAMVDILVIRALDAEGNNIFKKVDRFDLLNRTDPGIINRIVEAMGEDGELDAEDLEKN